MAAFEHEQLGADLAGKIGRPVAERGQRGCGRQADANRCDPAQTPPLHHGVDKMGGPDHDRVEVAARNFGMLAEFGQCCDDPAGDVGGGRGLDRMHDVAAGDEHGVGIGAADIDPDPQHAGPANPHEATTNRRCFSPGGWRPEPKAHRRRRCG